MNPTTVKLLRQAAIDALNSKEDIAAAELLSLMNVGEVRLPATTEPKALPESKELFEGPAHDYHYWMQFIREQFIPFMTSNGRLRFTSHELLTWLENCQEMRLTNGDVEKHSSGKTVWRNAVSGALGHLKQQGVLKAPAFGKEYEICKTLAIPPRRPALSTLRRIG